MWASGAWALMKCTEKSHALDKVRVVRVSSHIRDALPDPIAGTGIEPEIEPEIEHDGRAQGALQPVRRQKQLDGSEADQDSFAQLDSPCEMLDLAGGAAGGIALAEVPRKFVVGLRLIADRPGDCRLFTTAPAQKAAALGAQFHHGQTIEGIAVETGKVIGVDADFERRAVGGAYVRALGSYGPKVLRPIGINLPICPAKGCSAALPVMDDAPRSSIIDETHEVAMILDGIPDGTPVTGPSAYRNLFRTTVHGTPSWTMACRSGQAVADLALGKAPEISVDGLMVAR